MAQVSGGSVPSLSISHSLTALIVALSIVPSHANCISSEIHCCKFCDFSFNLPRQTFGPRSSKVALALSPEIPTTTHTHHQPCRTTSLMPSSSLLPATIAPTTKEQTTEPHSAHLPSSMPLSPQSPTALHPVAVSRKSQRAVHLLLQHEEEERMTLKKKVKRKSTNTSPSSCPTSLQSACFAILYGFTY